MHKIGTRVKIVISPKCNCVFEYTSNERILYDYHAGDNILRFKCPECKRVSQFYTSLQPMLEEDGVIKKSAIKFGDILDVTNLSADKYKFMEELE